MTFRELLTNTDPQAVLEEMVVKYPYVFFPNEIDARRYYLLGMGNLKKEKGTTSEGELTLIDDGISSRLMAGVKYPDGKSYTLILSDWAESIDREIEADMLSRYTPEFLLATLIQDFCFMGNSREKVISENEDLKASLLQPVDPKDGIPAEEVFAHMKAIIGNVPTVPEIGEKYKNISGEIFEVVFKGNDLSGERTIIGLKGENGCLSLTVDEMLRDISKVSFSDGKKRKYRFERID